MARNDGRGNAKATRTIAEADKNEALRQAVEKEAYLRREQKERIGHFAGEKSCEPLGGYSPRKLTPREKLTMEKDRLRFNIDEMDIQIAEINRKLTLLDSNPELEKLAEILAF